ncbi:MAG TPA: glycosyltransferase family 9 protein [Steroidobacteraceae bacterium]|nr:glycosyltransferase family 9 protein [Steroidobacteraceae bacterium]
MKPLTANRLGHSSRAVTGRWREALRGLERNLKLLVIAALRLLVHPPAARPCPQWSSRPHRILYLRYDHIGDMVLVTGIFHAIKRAQPMVIIDVLASVRNAPVLHGNPDVGTVYRIDKSRPWSFLVALARVRRVRYDAVLDSMVTGPSLTSMLIMWASGARHRIGVAGRGNDFALTLPVPRVLGAVHYVDHSAALLYPFGIDPLQSAPSRTRHGDDRDSRERSRPANDASSGWGVWRPRILLTESEVTAAEALWRSVEDGCLPRGAAGRARRLAVNVSAGAPWRCWPEDRFVAALREIRRRLPEIRILLIGTPGDERLKSRIQQASGVAHARTANAREMMAVIATCDLALTADTAVTHVACAFDKPVLAMFARGGAPHWGPYIASGRTVCAPGPTLASLAPEPVVQELERMLAVTAAPESLPAAAAGTHATSLDFPPPSATLARLPGGIVSVSGPR